MASNITFRTHLLGSVTDFCHKSELSTFHNALNLVELIVRLARYQEEGTKLLPKVYLTNNISEVIRMLPDAEKLKIGSADKSLDGIKHSLKKCAPLATGGWLVYLNENMDTIEYGLFRGASNPTAVLVDDVLMSSDILFNIVKVWQVADECVEIRSNRGDYHYIFLNHRKEDDPPPLQHLDNVVAVMTRKVKDKHRDAVVSYLKRVLFDSLVKSHGCIIGVTNMKKAPLLLSKDGILLDEPIDYGALIEDFKLNRIPQSLIDSKSDILSGMLNSDGIVLFDERSRILGFNIFVSTNNQSAPLGGARRRAFETLKGRVGKGISAIFMQSHDGWSDFYGESK